MISGKSNEKVPFLHKIDMYGSFCLIWMIWELYYLASSFTTEHAIMYVPYEMLLHSPIILEPTVDISSRRRLTCNRHFQLFLGSPVYLTDDFMSAVLTKAKSDEFLQHPNVATTFGSLRNSTNTTQVHLGLHLDKVCELLLPHHTQGGCISYNRIFQTCLSSSCGDKVFLCWWQHLRLVQIILFVHVLLFLPGAVVVILTMFDPPPLGFRFFARPWFVGVFFCTSSAMAYLYMALTVALAHNYLDQDIFFKTYSSADNPYTYYFGEGFLFIVVGASVNFLFGCCYFYITFFTPKYPRYRSRHEHRRGYFLIVLAQLRAELGLSEMTKEEYLIRRRRSLRGRRLSTSGQRKKS